MTALAARRRHPLALALLIALGLMATGVLYAAFAPRPAEASTASVNDIAEGHKLFLANCATCHGINAEGTKPDSKGNIAGPALVGVGAAAVDFQMSTGRMPLAMPGPQAIQKPNTYSQQDISKIAAYVASLAPGPVVPVDNVTGEGGDAARGGEIFRVNCAMCHNFTGAGGALTRGKYAPSILGANGTQVYEAMVTGPGQMPAFTDDNISPESKNDVIAYLNAVKNEPNQGGSSLGSMGPVSEGLFIWIVGIGGLVGCAVWLGAKAA